MEKEEKRGFVWHLLGATISILSVLIVYNFKNSIILVGLLCGICFTYSVYLNGVKGVKKGILKSLLFLTISFIVFLMFQYIVELKMENIIFSNTLLFSILLLPIINLIAKVFVIFMDIWSYLS